MKVRIIAEAGVNHNGKLELAKKLADEAKKSGADYVKFQTAVPELVMTDYADKALYQKRNTGKNESQLEMAKKIHLPLEDYEELFKYCDKIGIEFLSTPFDLVSMDYLINLGLNIFKIPSGEITNLPYLEKVGSLNKEIIMSTGMASLGEIESAISVLVKSGTNKRNITILHCNTDYPTAYSDVNLKAMKTIGKSFNINVGYSDHTLGIEISIAAVAMGATIIEKHFTLDRNMEGPDHKASLEPEMLRLMVKSIRNIEIAMGSGLKIPSQSESKNIDIARKSIVAAKYIYKNDIFTDENITVKRPGNGLSPMLWHDILGRKASRNFEKDELLEI